jgi:hypothetical protein
VLPGKMDEGEPRASLNRSIRPLSSVSHCLEDPAHTSTALATTSYQVIGNLLVSEQKGTWELRWPAQGTSDCVNTVSSPP